MKDWIPSLTYPELHQQWMIQLCLHNFSLQLPSLFRNFLCTSSPWLLLTSASPSQTNTFPSLNQMLTMSRKSPSLHCHPVAFLTAFVKWISQVWGPVLYLAPHTPGGLQVVLVDLVDSRWSPPGFHKNSHITPDFSGVHLESTWSPLDSIWTPIRLHMNFTKILDKCYKIICTLDTLMHFLILVQTWIVARENQSILYRTT